MYKIFALTAFTAGTLAHGKNVNRVARLFLSLLLLCGIHLEGKELSLFKATSVADTGLWSIEGGAQKSYSTEHLSGAHAGWIKAVFTAGPQRQRVVYNIPTPAGYYATLVLPNNLWRGYTSLKFDCYNPSSAPSTVYLNIGDFITRLVEKEIIREGIFPADSGLSYRHRQALTLAAGEQTVTIDITVPLLTVNGTREISTLDIRSFALEGSGAATVFLDNFRLEGTNPDAGTYKYFWPQKASTQCPNTNLSQIQNVPQYGNFYAQLHQLGFQDPYASHCPFCGFQLKQDPVEPQSSTGAQLLAPAQYRWVRSNNGGGSYVTATMVDATSEVHHYDSGPFYGWDERLFLKFDLAGVAKVIKKAEFRYFVNPTYYSGKVWFAPIQLWSTEDRNDEWMAGRPTYIRQPPLGRMLSHGGLYPWNPDIYARGGDGPLLTPISRYGVDITQYIKDQQAGDKKAGIMVLAMVSFPSQSDPHYYGHLVDMRGETTLDKRMHLYLELEDGTTITRAIPVSETQSWIGSNTSNRIDFYIPEITHVKISAYDVLGHRATSIANGMFEKGFHTKALDMGSNRGSGVYILRLQTEKGSTTSRIIHTGSNR